MKRDKKTNKPKLVLDRETVRVLDDDALHQARGGAGAMTGSKLMFQQRANNL